MLISHRDTKRVEEPAVMAVKPPEYTKTWHPVPHRDVLFALSSACRSKGLDVVKKQYSMSGDGAKMFGAWCLGSGDNDGIGYALGLRNSINKSLGVGICAGTNVFVCDNLAFYGKFIKFRKHTSGLDFDELCEISDEAIDGAVIEMKKMVDWQNELKEIWLSTNEQKSFVYDLIGNKILPGSKFNRYHEALAEERTVNPDLAENLYPFHGAMTRLMRDWNLLAVASANRKLNVLCNMYADTSVEDQT